MNDQQIEQEIQARGLTTGRRITPDETEADTLADLEGRPLHV